MDGEVYKRLQEQLDQYSVGFPVTESGVEMRILKKLFTEEEAEMFLLISLIPETSESVAQRTGRDPAETAAQLRRMAEKGLLFRHEKAGTAKYGALPFLPGVFEQQVESMDRDLARMCEDYCREALHENLLATQPVLMHRPVPINRVVDVSSHVPTYANSREIIRNQTLIAVGKCICRVQKGMLDDGCDKPVETCFFFGTMAQFYIDRNIGRKVTTDEALEILAHCQEAGLVTQPLNTQTPANICNCCPDCCIVLEPLKRHPRPAEVIRPYYRSVLDQEACDGCGNCVERCPMDAITLGGDGAAGINPDRCIGCGLCVPTCPTDALRLEARPEEERVRPPETGQQLYMEMARRRGKSLVPLALAG